MAETSNAPANGGPVDHKPYVPDDRHEPEFTLVPIILGSLLGIVFGASSLYLVLKVGMTVSASIPVAVLAITLFRGLSKITGMRPATILENNIVQTAGSAGESIAFGVGVTMPALLLIGFDMSLPRIMVVSILGGVLGILMMIPLRRAFIVQLHGKPGEEGKLIYPEGTACAQVLIQGDKGGASGLPVFAGFGIAFVHKIITETLGILKGTVVVPLNWFSKMAAVTSDMASEMLGVGYIIGTRTSSIMMAGAVLGSLVLAPLIYFFGADLQQSLLPADKPIHDMKLKDIHSYYIRFIGAGCVSAAGIISMLRTLPMIFRSIMAGLGNLGSVASAANQRRTEKDMPMSVVIFGSIALLGVLAFFLLPEVGPVGAVLGAALVLLFGFLFVTVSSRLTGEIGSSANPISGMTVATLLMTCLIFLGLGMTSKTDAVLALSIGGVVCIAASNGGTTSQDLKTGFLVGATPRAQQWAILIGALTSAVVIGFTLLMFNQAGTIYSQKDLPDVTLEQSFVKTLRTETIEGKEYRIWWPTQAEEVKQGDKVVKVPARKYLVNETSGKLEKWEDPTITGKLETRDDGSRVTFKFEAPKTQVMGIIINGLLNQQLNWTLILIGAAISIMLELCGIGSLAFAVGVYLPMSNTAPIFLGGLARWVVDTWIKREAQTAVAAATTPEAKAQAEIDAIVRSETNPGVLLASGFIAGGSMGGVLYAFLNFSPELVKTLDQSETLTKNSSFLQSDVLALVLFGVLIVMMVLAGVGRLFSSSDASSNATESEL